MQLRVVRTMTSVLALLWAMGCTNVAEPEDERSPAGVEPGVPSDTGEPEDDLPPPPPPPEPGQDAGTSDDGGSSTGEPPPPPGDDSSTGEPPPQPGLGCEGRDDLLLCDDFEDGAIDGSVWEIIENNGGEVSVDETFAFHGSGALRVQLPSADGARGGIRTRDDTVFPVPDNHLYGRAWFYLGPAVPQTHCDAIAARGDLDGARAHYRLDSNGGSFNSRYVHNPTVEQHGGLRKHGYDVPLEEWTCIEWEYDGSDNGMRYWMNGEEVTEMTVTADSEEQPWVAPIFEEFEIGWRTYQGAPQADEYEIYWDALALASFRIGCE